MPLDEKTFGLDLVPAISAALFLGGGQGKLGLLHNAGRKKKNPISPPPYTLSPIKSTCVPLPPFLS